MSWLAVDKDGTEAVYEIKPMRTKSEYWMCDTEFYNPYGVELPKGSIKKLIDRELTWEDEPVKF